MAAIAQHLEPNRIPINRLGLYLFMASESMLFLALAATRFYLTGLSPIPGINEPLGLVLTLVLIASSVFGYRADGALAKGDRSSFLSNILVTLTLGVVFVLGVVYEWATAEAQVGQVTGTVFFSMTGFHVLHVLSGLVVLALVYRLGAKGQFTADSHWGVTAALRYWTFVDAVWLLCVWPVLYLISLT
jgi:cytochrome c oxidase subunit 3